MIQSHAKDTHISRVKDIVNNISELEPLFYSKENILPNMQRIKRSTDNAADAFKHAPELASWKLKNMSKRPKRIAFTEIKKTGHILNPLSPENCGTSIVGRKVTGGNETEKGKWPWIVQLSEAIENNANKHLCGGVLISETHVLLAAHCFDNFR